MPLWRHFKPKQDGKLQESSKIKIMVSFCSYPTRNRKFQKNSKKIQKIKKILLWLHFNPKQVGEVRKREKIKFIVPFRSYLTRNRKFQKNRKKIQNFKKYHYEFISIQNRQEKSEKKTKSKLSFRFVPTRRVIENSKNIAKKLKI